MKTHVHVITNNALHIFAERYMKFILEVIKVTDKEVREIYEFYLFLEAKKKIDAQWEKIEAKMLKQAKVKAK